jgi:hypothetical protein
MNGHGHGHGAKRRKMSHGDDELVPDLGEMGMEGFGSVDTTVTTMLDEDILRNLDEDVDELLRQEGGGGGGGGGSV